MKINFNSIYRELSSVIKAPTRLDDSERGAKNFTKLLASVSPDKRQPPVISKESAAQPPSFTISKTASAEAMASIKFSAPSLKFQDLSRLGPSTLATPEVKEAPRGVKTPAILGIQRMGVETEAPAEVQAEIEEPRASLAPAPRPMGSASQQDTIARVADLVREAGKQHGVDPSLSMAVVSAESSFNPEAVSSDGHASKGLFQLLDSTGKDLLRRSGESASYDPFNVELNSNLGVGYLRYLHDLFSKESSLPNSLKTVAAANSSSLEKLAVAAFNAGEGRVASAQTRAANAGLDSSIYENVEAYLPENTQQYVRKVIQSKGQFEDRFIG